MIEMVDVTFKTNVKSDTLMTTGINYVIVH